MRLRRLLSTCGFDCDRCSAALASSRSSTTRSATTSTGAWRRMSPAACRASRRAGGVARLRRHRAVEGSVPTRRVNVIEHTVQDLRFAARHVARAPIATATMIGIFALGIGFSTALFLFVQSFVSGPVPGIPRQESLVRIRGIDRTQPGRAIGREFSYPEYRECAAQRTLFSDVAAWTSSDIVFDVGTREANPQSGAATYVTGNYFLPGPSPGARRRASRSANDADPRRRSSP